MPGGEPHAEAESRRSSYIALTQDYGECLDLECGVEVSSIVSNPKGSMLLECVSTTHASAQSARTWLVTAPV